MADRQEIDEERELRLLMARWLPEYRAEPMTVLGAGLDNRAFAVGDELILRLRTGNETMSVAAEAALLVAVDALDSGVPVPRPLAVVPEHGLMAYRKLAGIPLLELPHLHANRTIARTLGRLLARLHASTDAFRALVDVDDTPPAQWLDEAAHLYQQVAHALPAPAVPAIESFLAAPPPAAPSAAELAFTHNDLGIEHVLVDPETAQVTAVIDWSDAAVTDPACDLGRLVRDLAPSAAAELLAAHPHGEQLAARARFYARCALLEDLAHGLDTGRPSYRDKSLTGLEHLFPTKWSSR